MLKWVQHPFSSIDTALMQAQMLSVHSTIEILRTRKSIDAFANADANAIAQWEWTLIVKKTITPITLLIVRSDDLINLYCNYTGYLTPRKD